jgi:2-polyprenyl-3-methyl-5-hydroxy-6-metoxy-1,4-benzoquinol methylase
MGKEFWEKNAEPWTDAIESHRIESRKVTNPAIVDAIIRRKPASVLDLGCGEGWIASELLHQGIEYSGLDFSSKLIELAQVRHPNASFEAIGYDEIIRGEWRGDWRGNWKTPHEFDLVVFNFSLFDENITPLLRKVSSFIKPSGAILIQTLHPRTALDPYEDGWKTEDFKTFPTSLRGQCSFQGVIHWYGRTLESWEKVFSQSGLKIREMTEPLDPQTNKPLSIIFVLGIELP